MKPSISRRGGAKRQFRAQRRALTAVGAAVCLALYGHSGAARAADAAPASTADPASDAVPQTLQEITVTATRRSQTAESVPYSLTVVTPQQLSNAGVTDIASLANEVPGLSMFDYGSRLAGATVPIIRGINATGEPIRGFRSFEESPVGVYVENSPVDGYIQLIDLSRIEVLRGPQGTLYGAGSLGGALRLIPNDPKLHTVSGEVEMGSDRIAHSSGTGYTLDGVLNLPIASTMAFRVAAKYDYQPGWINVYGLLKRSNPGISGIPELANPADPVGSSAIYSGRADWNWQKTFTGRASLLWQPVDAFKAVLAVLHTSLRGDGGPQVNPDFAGGASPLDPSVNLPAGGPYQEFSQVDQPFSRYSNLTSLDMSYDAGFATLSSTSSYRTTTGHVMEDDTYRLAGVDGGAFLPYYAGIPTNPRFVYDYQFDDRAHAFTQELRLVSNTRLLNLFDYVVGVFYDNETRAGAWNIANPGSPERSVVQGCTSAAFYGATFPECLAIAGPGDLDFTQIDTQQFEEKSVYGDLTWHFAPHAQVTGGFRHFEEQFTDAQLYEDFTFPTLIPATPHHAPSSTNIGKVDVSYQYATGQYLYALWSQGFRRGGANSVPLTGPFQESPLLSSYAPDRTNNYEIGLKGRFANGLTYSFDVFEVKWDKPQISSSLPSGNLAVYNADTAESKGFELETAGPLLLPGLTYNVGVSYADAKLTSDFSLPANNGLGVITPGEISGKSGERMPGSPKTSITAAIDYQRMIAPGYALSLSLNGSYHSPIVMGLTAAEGTTAVQQSSSYLVMNVSAALSHDPWQATIYVTNLADKEEILAPPTLVALDDLTNDYVVNEPRMIGVRLAYLF
ncbi:MAG TPA: TonB-dependent receptor [Steroidobacteraceae bacterium]|nr:TonB-dependent receptor [Steroidobacteraceae bacterium]